MLSMRRVALVAEREKEVVEVESRLTREMVSTMGSKLRREERL